MNKRLSNKKILFQQQEVENTLLCAREVMDMTARFLCSLVKHQSNHDQQNIIYSLALSYAQIEQSINEKIETNFGINCFKATEQTMNNMLVEELKIKLEQLTEQIEKDKLNRKTNR